jgi:IS30 family transposase
LNFEPLSEVLLKHSFKKQKIGRNTVKPHSPWQKGANENFNERLRRFLPKGASFRDLTQSRLDQILHTMNHTPRKCLDWASPAEVFSANLTPCCASDENLPTLAHLHRP